MTRSAATIAGIEAMKARGFVPVFVHASAAECDGFFRALYTARVGLPKRVVASGLSEADADQVYDRYVEAEAIINTEQTHTRLPEPWFGNPVLPEEAAWESASKGAEEGVGKVHIHRIRTDDQNPDYGKEDYFLFADAHGLKALKTIVDTVYKFGLPAGVLLARLEKMLLTAANDGFQISEESEKAAEAYANDRLQEAAEAFVRLRKALWSQPVARAA